MLIVGALQKSTALRTLETMSKIKYLFPPAAIATNGVIVMPSILGGLIYHKGLWTRLKKNNNLLLCYKQSAEQQGNLHLEHKEAFGTVFKAKREDQTGGEGKE